MAAAARYVAAVGGEGELLRRSRAEALISAEVRQCAQSAEGRSGGDVTLVDHRPRASASPRLGRQAEHHRILIDHKTCWACPGDSSGYGHRSGRPPRGTPRRLARPPEEA